MPTVWFLSLLLVLSTAHAVDEKAVATAVRNCVVSSGPYEPVIGELDSSSVTEDVYLLVRGFKGTNILRVIPKHPDEKPYLLKVYGNPDRYFLELKSYRLVQETIQQGEETTFPLNAFEDLGPDHQMIKFADLRGKSLAEVLRDRRVPDALKADLRADYEAKYAALKRMLVKKLGMNPIEAELYHAPAFWFETTEAPYPLKIIVSADQVVVSFDSTDPAKFTLTLSDTY